MIIQAFLSGLAMGNIYALVALGYNITWNTTNVLNFGQGEFLMIGALIGWTCYITLGVSYINAILIAIGVIIVLGIFLEKFAIRPVRHLLSIGWIMSTIGVGIILKNTAILLWGANQLNFPSPFGEKVIRILDAGIYPQELFIIIASITTMIIIEILHRKTIFGKAILATAYNKNAASLMGINVNAMIILSFVISGILAALGGVFIAPITSAWPNMGTNLGLKAFAAAIIGGLESAKGCIIGGIILGIMEFIIAGWHAELKEISVFIIIIIFLVFRPNGIFGPQAKEGL